MKQKIVSIACMVLALAVLQGLAFAGKIRNPLASTDQLYAENLAMYLVTTPEVIAAKQTLSEKWLASQGTVSAEQTAYFESSMDEIVFAMALWAVSADPNYPRLVSILAAPHSWFGMDVPGSRYVFDNPDTTYRAAAVSSDSSYVIKGKYTGKRPTDENYSVWNSSNGTIANLRGKDLVVKPDGSFKITVDSSAANGRNNHIQITPDAKCLFIRNTIKDWGTEKFTTLSIERVGGPALPDPRTFDDLVTETVTRITNIFSGVNIYINRVKAQDVNTLPVITRGGTSGTLATQAQEYSGWSLADDEALIVKVKSGGAKYFTCPVYNKWQITTDYVKHMMTLNNSQAVANPNGTYTFVISPKDPGVYNWIDTAGMHDGDLNLRWQRLPDTVPESGDVSATMKLVKLADLKSIFPAHTKWVTKQERKQQLKQRAKQYALRYSEY